MEKYISTENDGIEMLYRERSISRYAFDDSVVTTFNSVATELDLEKISNNSIISKEFNIPQYYKDIDVEEYVRSLVLARMESPDTVARVEEELLEYKARNMYPVLQLMIYIVDTMRKNDIVWGVGRGSSVASYLLYLIGVHKVDSIKYNLDIKEFLK